MPEEIVSYIMAGCAFIITLAAPLLVKFLARREVKKALEKLKDQTEEIKTLRLGLKQLERQLSEGERKYEKRPHQKLP